MAELGVFGIGIATADPELRSVGEKNTSVCTVSLAFNRSYKIGDGDWQKETCFLRAQVWGGRADRMMELVKKGQPLYICGYMKQDNWEKDGQKRTAHSITLRDFQLCEKNGHKKTDGSQQAVKSKAAKSSAAPPADDDDDIPF